MRTLYWSRTPGRFLHKTTGTEYVSKDGTGPAFTGTVREWYETLIETIIDAATGVEERGPLGIFVDERVLTIMQCSVLYRPELQNRFATFKDYPAGTVPKTFPVGSLTPVDFRTTSVYLREETIQDQGGLVVEVKIGDKTVGRVIVRDINII